MQKYVGEVRWDTNDEKERAELYMISMALDREWKKYCNYCKYNGHDFNTCPVRIELKNRCAHDGLRDRIRGRVSNNLRLASRVSLSSILGKRTRGHV